ncbi:hypothetical protein AA13595_1687 [Gluconacetobacter johannae DSM 13595]|uniref:Tetratricopeptide repeat protein n=1 Tax=Gluconacetobacter johannae TaxID=112140 RepID=A0A7W4P4Z5_9PROT|nr:tetratricopeptide repeat protein [Gluconacetobacter johannae]MBB2177537.1 tetratricopeptide repeat protein [Gluconacetobacter johannae]GBQ85563.1 hypothetical protein AA13595_1687 [Gluconacetobacter johannae DSM 13595]
MVDLFSRLFRRRRHLIVQADENRDQGKSAEAARLYQKIIDEWGAKPSLLMQLGNSLKDSRNYEKAYTAYMQVWESENRSADVALQLGHLLKLQGDFDNAKKWYSHSIELDGNDNNPAHRELLFVNAIVGGTESTDRQHDDLGVPSVSFPEEAVLRHFRTELQYRPS